MPTDAITPAARRMRLYRDRVLTGARPARLDVNAEQVDMLVRLGFIDAEDLGDMEALGRACRRYLTLAMGR